MSHILDWSFNTDLVKALGKWAGNIGLKLESGLFWIGDFECDVVNRWFWVRVLD